MFEKIIPYLSEKMSREEIDDLVLNVNSEFEKNIELLADKVKNGGDKISVLEEVSEICNNEIFCKLVLENLSEVLIPFEEMRYLRELEFNEFVMLINYMFENLIIHLEDPQTIANETKLDEQNIIYIKRLLYTLLQLIIVRRHTFNWYKSMIFDMFRFDEKKTTFLWELYCKNKEQLINIVVLENIQTCKDIRDEMDRLNRIFSEIEVDEE